MSAELGIPFRVCATAAEACGAADVIFTSTPGSNLVLEKGWLQPHATIIAAGSDQPTKQELPADVVEASHAVHSSAPAPSQHAQHMKRNAVDPVESGGEDRVRMGLG